MSQDINWEDPPIQPGGGAVKHVDLAAQLRAHPKRWARVLTSDEYSKTNAFAQNISHGRLAAFREGQWEAIARRVGDGEYATFARFVGDDLGGAE